MRIKILALVTALFIADAATAAPAIPNVSAIVLDRCTDHLDPAFEVLIARPGQGKVDIESPWLRIFVGVEPKAYSSFTFRFDNIYVTVYLNGITSEKVKGTVTFPRIEDGKNLKGTFELVTPTEEHITGRFNAPWAKPRMLCGVGRSFPQASNPQ
jgi:hypothetical protein